MGTVLEVFGLCPTVVLESVLHHVHVHVLKLGVDVLDQSPQDPYGVRFLKRLKDPNQPITVYGDEFIVFHD